tara:strand:- start:784 stop:1233 length:450 start_codon:yes stop_codon:yes gene_type:complete
MSDFKNDAIDGDGDGFVQDGTEWERPVEEVAVEPETTEEPETESPAPVEEKGEVISSPEPSEEAEPALALIADGVIGTGSKKKTSKKATKPAAGPKEATVALYSTRNVTWVGVGRVLTGLNLVSESESVKWLERDHIRKAEPSEVSREL